MTTENASVTKPRKRSPRVQADQTLTLAYSLSDLPTTQHRAGLAGLVCFVKRMQPMLETDTGRPTIGDAMDSPRCRITHLDDERAVLEINRRGLDALMDAYHAAEYVEKKAGETADDDDAAEAVPVAAEPVKPSKKSAAPKPPELRLSLCNAFLRSVEPPDAGRLWINLWETLVRTLLKPAAMGSFQQRGRNIRVTEDKIWKNIQTDRVVDLSGTICFGAQSHDENETAFQDRGRNEFLLRFWSVVTRIYVPEKRGEGRRTENNGQVIAIPYVTRLVTFCDAYLAAMPVRGARLAGFVPREARIDQPVEAAIDFEILLAAHHGAGSVALYDVAHIAKPAKGNTMSVFSQESITPTAAQIATYLGFPRGSFWDPVFRSIVSRNAMEGRAWHEGFRAVLSFSGQSIESYNFCHDANAQFNALLAAQKPGDDSMSSESNIRIDLLIRRLMFHIVRRRVEYRTNTSWERARMNPQTRMQWFRHIVKAADDYFRGLSPLKSDTAIIMYFTKVLCSRGQVLTDVEFAAVSDMMSSRTQHFQALALLSLAACRGDGEYCLQNAATGESAATQTAQ